MWDKNIEIIEPIVEDNDNSKKTTTLEEVHLR